MATCIVSGILKDPSNTAISGAIITANITTPYFSGTVYIAPKAVTTTSAADGTWSLTLNETASVTRSLTITIDYPPNSTDSQRRVTYAVIVPALTSCDFSTIATEL